MSVSKDAEDLGSRGGVRTDYGDEGLLIRATSIYQVESQKAQHYETQRTYTTNVVVVATGAIVAFALQDPLNAGIMNSALVMLFVIALVSTVMCARLGHAHLFHWYLALKMRNIIINGKPKLVAKKEIVDEKYESWVGNWKLFDHEISWLIINFSIPFGGSLVVLFHRYV